MSEQAHRNIHDAMLAARGRMPHPHKSADVDAGRKRYKFAPLSTVLDIVLAACSAEGLGVWQDAKTVTLAGEWVEIKDKAPVFMASGTVEVRTVVTMGIDRVEFGPYACPWGGGAQDVGIATTYARRYALLTTFGLYGEDDQDGITLAELTDRVVSFGERRTRDAAPAPASAAPAPKSTPKRDATAHALRRAGCESKADADAVSILLLERPCPPPEDTTGRNELLEAITSFWAQWPPNEPTRLLSEALDLSDRRMAAAERAAKEGA